MARMIFLHHLNFSVGMTLATAQCSVRPFEATAAPRLRRLGGA
jgi:hypothetical protein